MNKNESMKLIDFVRKNNHIKESDVNYPYIKMMSDGHIVYLNRLAFTWGLCFGPSIDTAFIYRFCFPSLTDAIKAFEEADNLHYVPREDWVAARPEGRLMLPKEMVGYFIESYPSQKAAKMIDKINQNKTIDCLIEEKIYNISAFDWWMKKNKITYGDLDVGVQHFYDWLKQSYFK